MTMAQGKPVRVAVVGARGIGKHHAKWWALEGAVVCGFVGTTKESVARTREVLLRLFGLDIEGYTNLETLLDAAAPEFVDVCSPPAWHLAHARAAINAGCHVLCEKPLVYDESLSSDAMLAEARGVLALAEEKGKLLGVCTQYSAGAAVFARVWKEQRGNEPIAHYYGHLESPARDRPADPGRVWVDLAPHPLSVLIHLVPEARVDWSTLDIHFGGYEARATFEVRRPSVAPIRCEIVTRNATKPPLNVRRFKLNGYPFVVEGEQDEQGVYRARIETPDGRYHEPDMMHQMIRAMLAGCPIAAGREALDNLEWMLQILDFAREK